MFPTAARLSKASRAPLTPKRGNKDFYKGTRQAFLPGGRRTGAPGRHVIRGSAKYQLIDEKVRVYVAPPIEDIEECELKPYVSLGAKLTEDHKIAVFGKFRGTGGLTPERFLRVAREHSYARTHPESPVKNMLNVPLWMSAQIKLGVMEEPKIDELPLREYRAKLLEERTNKTVEDEATKLRELEIVEDSAKGGKSSDAKKVPALEAISDAPSARSSWF